MSLRARVTLAFTAVLAVVLAAAGAFLFWTLSGDLQRTQDRGLRARAAQVVAAVEDGTLARRLPRVPGVEADEDVAQVLAADGRVLAGSPAARVALLDARQRSAALRDARVRFADRPGDGRHDEALRLLAVAATPPDGARVVAVTGASATEVAEARATLLWLEVGGLGAALLAGAAGAWVLAGAVVRPVRTALERERRFVADAGHELRTPLTVLKAELEVTRMEAGGPDALRAALASAEEEVDRLARLANDLLVLARADAETRGGAPPAAPVEVAPVARRAVRGLPVTAVEVQDGLAVRADPLRLEQALRNLAANALEHGAPPVTVGARRTGGEVVIAVRDHGPGLPSGFAPQATARFSRADPGRSGGGAGLGLAIVEAVARAHGGELRLRGAQPGLLAELVLPAAVPGPAPAPRVAARAPG